MLLKNICAVVALSFGAIASAQAADKMYDFKFQEAVNRAVADGVLDGSVKLLQKMELTICLYLVFNPQQNKQILRIIVPSLMV
jgi:hypothetical protein